MFPVISLSAVGASSVLRSLRSQITAAASVRRTTSVFSICSAGRDRRIGRARVSVSHTSVHWYEGSGAPYRSRQSLIPAAHLPLRFLSHGSAPTGTNNHDNASHHHHDRRR